MNIKNQEYLQNTIIDYLKLLRKDDSNFKYNISNESNLTRAGALLELGFSCFALKIKVILNDEDLNAKTTSEWANFINNFQKNITPFPSASFVDNYFLNEHTKFNLNKASKNLVKKTLNKGFGKNYILNKQQLYSYISAESKQAISTLNEIGYENKIQYIEFPKTEESIIKYLDSFNWENPWSAGAQFSTLCLFTETQISDNVEVKQVLKNYIKTKLDVDTGFYHTKKNINENILINGAMKVLTGLDWIDEGIHNPEKIVDFVLKSEITNEACDLVDVVYVLFRCSQQTNYRKLDIINFINKVEDVIFKNFIKEEGGFSYSYQKSQKFYYGLIVTKQQKYADLHGTLLLLWAYTLILELKNENNLGWKIIKP